MKIYTKRGDEGLTDLPGNRRLRKDDPRIEAVGMLDELNANLGWAIASINTGRHEGIRAKLQPVQAELQTAAALVASAGVGKDASVELDDRTVERMEQQMDEADKILPELTHFILLQGCELACRLHVTRTVCRRAERALAGAKECESEIPPIVLRYVNRLSDLLFVLARLANYYVNFTEPLSPGPAQRLSSYVTE